VLKINLLPLGFGANKLILKAIVIIYKNKNIKFKQPLLVALF